MPTSHVEKERNCYKVSNCVWNNARNLEHLALVSVVHNLGFIGVFAEALLVHSEWPEDAEEALTGNLTCTHQARADSRTCGR